MWQKVRYRVEKVLRKSAGVVSMLAGAEDLLVLQIHILRWFVKVILRGGVLCLLAGARFSKKCASAGTPEQVHQQVQKISHAADTTTTAIIIERDHHRTRNQGFMALGTKRKRRRILMRRKRVLDSSLIIDYKKPDVLKKFITERGKIIPSRVSGATSAQQLALSREVKRARYLALIPASVAHEKEKGFVGEMSEIAQTFAASTMRQRSRGSWSRGHDAGEAAADSSGDDVVQDSAHSSESSENQGSGGVVDQAESSQNSAAQLPPPSRQAEVSESSQSGDEGVASEVEDKPSAD